LLHVRARWAAVTNEALQEAHIATRIDHRTLEAQGIDREPRPRIPQAAFEMERHGYRSVVGDRMREEYQARVQARLDRVARPEVPSVAALEPMSPPSAPKRQSLEDIRREARENWLRLRQSQREGLDESVPSTTAARDRKLDDDLTR